MVRSLAFDGNHAIDDYTLSIAIGTTNSSWFARKWYVRWLGLGEKRYFDPIEFRRDVLRLTLFYRQSGFMEVKVDTLVRYSGRDVHLTFRITEGPPVVVRDAQGDRSRLRAQGQGDRRGAAAQGRGPVQSFSLPVECGLDRQPAAQPRLPRAPKSFATTRWIVRPASRDVVARRGARAVGGLRSASGSTGATNVDTTFIRQLLLHRNRASRFSQQDIFQSQRKLYQTELFRLATVTIDSAEYAGRQRRGAAGGAGVGGRSHRIRSSVGFATNDCFRGGAGWTSRNLFNTGRLFDLSARVSKVGVGRPFDFGLDNSLCKSLRERYDRVLQGQLQRHRPRCGSPGSSRRTITGTFSLFAERRCEFAIYRREEVGTSLALSGRPRGGCR